MTSSGSASGSGHEPQQTRGIATRERLLEATFESLYELGYAATTTVEVCKRTGIARGSLLHQFPTRADLLASAVEYVFERRVAAFREAIGDLPPDGGRPSRVIELLWREVSGPPHYAWLELVVAARTDPDLRDRVRRVADRFDHLVQGVFGELFPEAPPILTLPNGFEMPREGAAMFAVSLLSWMAVDRILHDDRPEQRMQVRALQGISDLIFSEADDG